MAAERYWVLFLGGGRRTLLCRATYLPTRHECFTWRSSAGSSGLGAAFFFIPRSPFFLPSPSSSSISLFHISWAVGGCGAVGPAIDTERLFSRHHLAPRPHHTPAPQPQPFALVSLPPISSTLYGTSGGISSPPPFFCCLLVCWQTPWRICNHRRPSLLPLFFLLSLSQGGTSHSGTRTHICHI